MNCSNSSSSFVAILTTALTAKPICVTHTNTMSNFVSSYMRTHVVARFFASLMTGLDPARFERWAWHTGGGGDAWTRDRYDSHGNLMERKVPIRDKGGRGPSAQINESADRLQDFLSQRMGIERVYRAVVFAHESWVP